MIRKKVINLEQDYNIQIEQDNVRQDLKINKFLDFAQRHLPAFVLSIVTFLFYLPSLRYPFQFDDLANITKKFSIRNDNPLSRFFSSSRWIADWMNRLNYELDKFDPFYYRLFNLFIHIAAGILLFYLILTLCEKAKSSKFLSQNSILIAFATSGLFLLHPVQTQTVSYIIQGRLEGLASMLIIANLFVLIKAILSENKNIKFLLFLLSAIITFISFGAKEIVVITPILLFICDWFFLSNSNWENFKKNIWYHVGFALFFYILFFARYMDFGFFTRAVSLKMVTSNNRGNILTDHAQDVIKPLEFLISEFKVILHYLWIFIWPFNISVEYDWRLSQSFFALDSFMPFLVLLLIFSLFIYSIIKKYNLLSFGLTWFFLSIAPRTTIIPSPELLCDYKTYLASIGWLFILATILVYIAKFIAEQIRNINHEFIKLAQLATLLFLLIPVGTSTYYRNTVWRTAKEFWGDIVKKAPTKARAHNNYGVALSEAGKVDKAIKHYEIAINLDKYYSDPLSNIAVAYSMKNEIDKAIHALEMALLINPSYPEAFNNIGSLYLSKKDYTKAEEFLNKAITLRPYYGKALYNKGRLYMEKNDENTAWTYFKKATEGDLDTPDGFFTLGQLSIRLQKYQDAATAFEKIISLGVNNEAVYFNLGNSYYMLKDYDKAEKIYSELVRNNPTDTRYFYNLAETYFVKNETEKALNAFQKVTTMPNSPGQAHLRIVACLENLDQKEQVDKYLEELLKTNAPEEFKQAINTQKAQIELNRKIKSGNGSIKMGDLKKILAQAKPEEKKAKA